MALELITAPTIEPVTLAEIKEHLRLDSDTLSENLTPTQSIVPAAHAVAGAYSLVGTGVDVLDFNTVVILNAGTCGAGATVDVKIQDSDDNITYSDWTGGAFTQVTTSNDNAIFEKEYTGALQYVRVVATVAVDACAFGVTVVAQSAYSAEDTLITEYLKAAREYCEEYQNLSYITQTWDLYLDQFPVSDTIEIPRSPLQSVTSIKYYDTDETEATFTSADYHIDIVSIPGRIRLAYGDIWPTDTLRTVNGVIIRVVLGYGDAATDVPYPIKEAIKLLTGHYYENREATVLGTISRLVPMTVHDSLNLECRNWIV